MYGVVLRTEIKTVRARSIENRKVLRLSVASWSRDMNKIKNLSNPTSRPSSSVEPLISALSTAAASQLETLDLLGDGLEVVTLIRSFKSIRINIFSDLCTLQCRLLTSVVN